MNSQPDTDQSNGLTTPGKLPLKYSIIEGFPYQSEFERRSFHGEIPNNRRHDFQL